VAAVFVKEVALRGTGPAAPKSGDDAEAVAQAPIVEAV